MKRRQSMVPGPTSAPATSPGSGSGARHAPRKWQPTVIVGLSLVSLTLLAGYAGGWLIRSQREAEKQTNRSRALKLAQSRRLEAEPLLTELVEQNPHDLEVIKALAGLQLVADQPAQAEGWLARWCDLEPANPVPLRLRFEIAARVHDQELALLCGTRLIEMEPDPDPVLRKLMWIEVGAGKFAEAVRHAEEGLKRKPGDPEYRFLLAHVKHAQGAWPEAVRILDELLSEPGAIPQVLLLRGTIHREQKQPEAAVALLRKVLTEKTAPRDRQVARFQLAQALFQLGKLDEAREEMTRWQRFEDARRALVDAYQQPDNQELRLRAGRLQLESDQTAEGVALLEAVLERDPTQREAHRLLADHFERQGDRQRAQQHRMHAVNQP
ncbi:MAG: tetratricopeptide repeat protein [Gemmataceae bacterium]